MYICPVCNRGFNSTEVITKHSLQCWKEHNPNHVSKPAPFASKTKRQMNDEISQFFARFTECQK